MSPVRKQYTRMPQHTVSAKNESNDATQPPHERVSAVSARPVRRRIWPASRHTIDTATPAKATTSPINPNVDMEGESFLNLLYRRPQTAHPG